MREPWRIRPDADTNADGRPDLPVRPEDLPPPCASGDITGDGRVTSADVLKERDCLAVTEPALRAIAEGWQSWWREQGADGQ